VVIGEEILNLNTDVSQSIVVMPTIGAAFGVADRIAVIHEGKILAVAQPDEIRKNQDPWIQNF